MFMLDLYVRLSLYVIHNICISNLFCFVNKNITRVEVHYFLL